MVQRESKETTEARSMNKIFAYNQETGVITWLVTKSSHGPAGSVAGTINKDGYRRVRVDGKRYMAHRLAWFLVRGEWPRGQLDHINGSRDDNRIVNLREVTVSQNQTNARRHRDSKAPYKGITFSCGKWVAQISIDGRQRSLGRFETPEAAHARYCEAAQEAFGEFWRPA